jgi:hypothetical protein
MFGGAAERPARKALELFQKETVPKILELGGGQGRDTIFFGQSGLQVVVPERTIGMKAAAALPCISLAGIRSNIWRADSIS